MRIATCLLLVLCTTQGARAADNESVVLFPASDFDMRQIESKGVDVKLDGNALVCQQATQGDWPHFTFDTQWDAVKYPHLVIEAENLCDDLVRFYLRILPQRKDGKIDAQPFVDIEAGKKILANVTSPIVDSPLRPDVIQKLSGIRGYPGDTKRRNRPPLGVEPGGPLSGTVGRLVFAIYQNGKAREIGYKMYEVRFNAQREKKD